MTILWEEIWIFKLFWHSENQIAWMNFLMSPHFFRSPRGVDSCVYVCVCVIPSLYILSINRVIRQWLVMGNSHVDEHKNIPFGRTKPRAHSGSTALRGSRCDWLSAPTWHGIMTGRQDNRGANRLDHIAVGINQPVSAIPLSHNRLYPSQTGN